MTPEEQQLLADLASRISQTPPVTRDPEADAFIRTHIGNRPDALYLMTQTVLLQNAALEQARMQVDQARAQVQQMQQQTGGGAIATGGSFLGGGRQQGFGQPGSQPTYQPGSQSGYQQAGNPQAGYAQGGYPPPPPPAYGAPAQQPGGGFLRGAAQTAAGVAGGMLAFQGVEALLGGLTHGFGGYGGSGMGGFGGHGETIIENNYYGEPGREHDGNRFDSQGGDSFLGPNSNTDYSTAPDDILPADDTIADDTTADDNSDADSGSSDDFSGDDDSGSNAF